MPNAPPPAPAAPPAALRPAPAAEGAPAPATPGATVAAPDAAEPGGLGADSVEAAIRALEQGIARAYQANDAAYLGRVLADDYVVVDGPGTTSDKRKVLADHAARRLRVTGFRYDELRVRRLAPDVAAVTGQYTWEAAYDGRAISGAYRYARVYVRVYVRERAGARALGEQAGAATAGAAGMAGWRVTVGQVTPVRGG